MKVSQIWKNADLQGQEEELTPNKINPNKCISRQKLNFRKLKMKKKKKSWKQLQRSDKLLIAGKISQMIADFLF